MGASVSPISNIISGAEGLFNDSNSFTSFMSNLSQLGQGLGGVGKGIGQMSGQQSAVPSVASPKSISPTGTIAASPIASSTGAPTLGTITNPNPGANPVATVPSTLSSTIPSVPTSSSDVGTNFTKNLTSQVGSGLSNTITNFLNSLGPNSQQAVQAIINANQPNVQQGSAQLNENLAASGISPSSSVSAIENANYMAGVQQQNLSELAQTFLGEQSLTENLLTSLIPGQQQSHAESSPWNIISNVLGGIGSFFGL